jgi:hypothetical protein
MTVAAKGLEGRYGDLMFGGICTFKDLAVAKIPHHTI